MVVRKLSECMVWHQRLGHLNHQSLKLLKSKDLVTGLPDIGKLDSCDDCMFGKCARSPFVHKSGKIKESH